MSRITHTNIINILSTEDDFEIEFIQRSGTSSAKGALIAFTGNTSDVQIIIGALTSDFALDRDLEFDIAEKIHDEIQKTLQNFRLAFATLGEAADNIFAAAITIASTTTMKSVVVPNAIPFDIRQEYLWMFGLDELVDFPD